MVVASPDGLLIGYYKGTNRSCISSSLIYHQIVYTCMIEVLNQLGRDSWRIFLRTLCNDPIKGGRLLDEWPLEERT